MALGHPREPPCPHTATCLSSGILSRASRTQSSLRACQHPASARTASEFQDGCSQPSFIEGSTPSPQACLRWQLTAPGPPRPPLACEGTLCSHCKLRTNMELVSVERFFCAQTLCTSYSVLVTTPQGRYGIISNLHYTISYHFLYYIIISLCCYIIPIFYFTFDKTEA